jgi:hypothetical protein
MSTLAEALTQVESTTDPGWRAATEIVIDGLIRVGETFTADDVWEGLEDYEVSTPEPRAMGAVLTSYVNAGKIRAVGGTKSRRPQRHSGWVTVFEVIA